MRAPVYNMKYLDILATYVPALVVSHLLDDLDGEIPNREAFTTARRRRALSYGNM